MGIPMARENRIINDVRQKCIVGLCVGDCVSKRIDFFQ